MSDKVCCAEGCNKRMHARGLCGTHYDRQRKRNAVECSKDDCTKPVYVAESGLCNGHYEQQRRASAPPCSAPGCGTPSRKRGMCNAHCARWQAQNAPTCSTAGCTGVARFAGDPNDEFELTESNEIEALAVRMRDAAEMFARRRLSAGGRPLYYFVPKTRSCMAVSPKLWILTALPPRKVSTSTWGADSPPAVTWVRTTTSSPSAM